MKGALSRSLDFFEGEENSEVGDVSVLLVTGVVQIASDETLFLGIQMRNMFV